MRQRIAALTLLLTTLARCQADDGSGIIAGEFDVAPLTRYCLSFRAAGVSGNGAGWELQIANKDGELPYEGVFREEWQKIVPGRDTYSHSFLTPRDGVCLRVLFVGPRGATTMTDLKLESITNRDLVINGSFASGLANYSGWNDHHLAALETNSTGKIVLRCQPQGYALTDPMPVNPGATYRYTKGSYQGGRVLVYDRDLLRVGAVEDAGAGKEPLLKMPADAAFMRIAYCDGRDWAGRVPVIDSVGVELVAAGEGAEAEKEIPSYPGEIVLAPQSPLAEVRAAREIQHWVRRISGKEMRVLAAPSARRNTKIYVGRTWAERLFPPDLTYLEGSDGFAVRKTDSGIYVFGARPSGTLFGAIRFLEQNTDLIWARPNREFGTVFSPDPDLAFTNADMRVRPAFVYRMSGSGYANRSDDGIWHGRAGLNTSAYLYNKFERAEMGGTPSYDANYMATIAQSDRYAFEKCKMEHPEFFALVNGKRLIAPQGYICYTAPGIAEAIAEGLCEVVKKAEARGERLEHLSIRTRDGWTVCSCESCMQPIKLPDGSLLRPKADTSEADPLFFSTRMAIMLNKVAESFAKTHPEIPITVPGYIYSSSPPAVPHAPSLIPSFCAYDTCSLRFPILDGANNHASAGREWENKFREFLRRNGTEHRQLSMFAYYYCAGFATLADSAAADWLSMAKSGGVHGIHMDGFSADAKDAVSMWDYQAIERWIMARLMWDPTLDPQALRDEYILKAYGTAAPQMREFYRIVRQVWEDPAIKYGPNCHASSSDLFDTLIVKTGNEEKLRTLLVEAEQKALNPASRMLVQRTLMAFDSFAKGLNRLYVPLIRESTTEWNVANSTFWLQALKLGDFKRVSTWDDFHGAPASNQTEVAVMRDSDNLYFRFRALGAGKEDRVELILTAERGEPSYYFALDCGGKRNTMERFVPMEIPGWAGEVKRQDDTCIVMFKVPLASIRELNLNADTIKLYAKCARLAGSGREAEESSLTGTSITRTHYMNYWTALSIAKEGAQQ